MIINNMPWHNAANLGESAVETAERVFQTEDWIRGENRISSPTARVIFDKHIQFDDLLEVTTTTEPSKKKITDQVGTRSGF